MTPDFWAGYFSGIVGVLVGNPLDVAKVQMQSGRPIDLVSKHASKAARRFTHAQLVQLTRGATAPVLGYGALNALLFMSYNKTLLELDPSITDPKNVSQTSLGKVWVAGTFGGLASWLVSAPTELVKCRVQLSQRSQSSCAGAKHVWISHELKGMYLGGGVTSVRDAIGYGFYFWSYELCKRELPTREARGETIIVLLSGGIAGCVMDFDFSPRRDQDPHPRLRKQSFVFRPQRPVHKIGQIYDRTFGYYTANIQRRRDRRILPWRGRLLIEGFRR